MTEVARDRETGHEAARERREAQQSILEHLAILEWALHARLGKDTVEYGGAQRIIGEVIDAVEVIARDELAAEQQEEPAPQSGPVAKDEERVEELEAALFDIGKTEEEMQLKLAQLALDAHNLMSIRGQETPHETMMRHAKAAESMTVQIAALFRHTVTLRELASVFGKKDAAA